MTTEIRDPVCGMSVKPSTPNRFDYEGREYLFCSGRCLEKFKADPKRYLRHAGASSFPPASDEKGKPAEGTIYTCPMHPEVRKDGPGSCPKCGMALEPLSPVAGEEESAEYRDMRRRFWFAAALSAPLLALSMGDMLLGHAPGHGLSSRARVWIELFLALPVCTWAVWPFYVRAVDSIKNLQLNMFTLIGLGVSVAFL